MENLCSVADKGENTVSLIFYLLIGYLSTNFGHYQSKNLFYLMLITTSWELPSKVGSLKLAKLQHLNTLVYSHHLYKTESKLRFQTNGKC